MGTVVRTVAIETREPTFESIHQQFYKENSLLLPVKKTKIKIKMKEMSNFLTTSPPVKKVTRVEFPNLVAHMFVFVPIRTNGRTDE